MKTPLLYLALILLLLTSCQSKSPNSNFMGKNSNSTTWQIVQFTATSNSQAELSFEKTSFKFAENGALILSENSKKKYGTWSIQNDEGTDDLPAKEISIYLDFNGITSLNALSGNWIILTHTADSLALIRNDKSKLIFKAAS